MSALFARIARQAFVTFDQSNVSKFGANFSQLKSLVDQLTPSDLNLDPELMQTRYFYNRPNKAPVTYLNIFEHETFTMSVFIMANHYTMPMHDHPGFGILKVLSGTASIQSYSLVNATDTKNLTRSHALHVIKEPIRNVSAKNESSVLTPTKGNIHEITAVGPEPAAFFDILSPPYNSTPLSKECSFFKNITLEDSSADGLTSSPMNCDRNGSTTESSTESIPIPNARLQACSTPLHYYCDTVEYYPPEFLMEHY